MMVHLRPEATSELLANDTGIQALIARVENATGADRDIENAIEALFGDAPLTAHGLEIRWPHYTTSLDAVMQLVEREPMAIERLDWWPGHPSSATILTTHVGKDGQRWHSRTDGDVRASATAPTLPLALLLAFLRAHALLSSLARRADSAAQP